MSTKTRLDKLDNEIQAALEAGDRARAAGLHGEKAAVYALAFDLQNAAKELAKANVLAAEDGQVEVSAMALLAQGKALAVDPSQHNGAADALNKAAALFSTLENSVGESEALALLAQLEMGAGRPKKALEKVSRAIDLLDAKEHSKLLIERLQQRAMIYWMVGEGKSAETDIIRAISHTNDPALRLELEVQQAALQNVPDVAQLQALWQQATQRKQFDLVADLHLQKAQTASAREQWDDAIREADMARKTARDSRDLFSPLRYLMATVILADGHEAAGNDVGALQSWLTCRTFLQHHLGVEVAKRIDMVLDALAQKWGRARMAKAIVRHQQQVAAEGKVEV